MYRITIEASYGEEVVHETACSNKEYLATSASIWCTEESSFYFNAKRVKIR